MIRASARQKGLLFGRRDGANTFSLYPSLTNSFTGLVSLTDDERRSHGGPSKLSRRGLCSIAVTSPPTWSVESLKSSFISIAPCRRQFSSNTSSSDSLSSKVLPSFGSKPIIPEADSSAEAAISSVLEAAEIASSTPFEPTWWPSDQVLVLLNYVNESILPMYPYAVTIGITTFAVRVLLFPAFVLGQRSSSRMAHMQPELKVLKDQLDKMGSRVDQQTQTRYMQQTRALFRKYDVNPMMGILPPLASAPFFMSMFFGLKNAPDYFPEILKDGGLLWFTDLTEPDPYYALPIISAMTFLMMTEVGKEQMLASDPKKGRLMVNAFRSLAIVMVPMTMYFNAGVFVYWTVNNSFSLAQSVVLKQGAVKKVFGIWDPPKPVPGQESKGIFEEMQSLMMKKEEQVNALAADRIKAHNEILERQKAVKKVMLEKEGLRKK